MKLKIQFFNRDSRFSYSNVFEDERFTEWTKTWKKIKGGSDESAKIMHTQKFFRMLLSQYSDDTSDYYYSLCAKDVVHDDYNWHCITCKKCERWNYWHCGTCDECEFMNKIFTQVKVMMI